MGIQAIQNNSIRYAVAEGLRSALREGVLKPGEDLNEAVLAQQFDISRAPLREALLVLVGEGLLVYTRNRGFSVIQISAEDGESILEVRIPLEARALERARDRVREADLQRLNEIKSQLVRMIDDRNTPAREAAEMAFHSYIWDLSGNPWLAMSLKRAMIPYFTFSVHLGVARLDLDSQQAEETHQLYLDYLGRKTPLDAMECVRRHLRRS